MAAETAHVIGIAIGKLTDRLTAKKIELHRRETSGGKSHDVRKMNRLREEIASLEARISRAERWQDRELLK